MFSQNSGSQPFWPGKYCSRSGNDLTRTCGHTKQIGRFIRGFSVSGQSRIGKLGTRILARSRGVTILAGAGISFCLNTALATPAFVQGNYAVPQSGQAVTVPYTAAQASGDLNVVVVGWGDTNATITSVTDSAGNTYHLAVGPTLLNGLASQSIYYAQNVLSSPANQNAVRVIFSTATTYPDVRIMEYSGVDQANPLDGSANATATGGTTTTSGTVATTNANDLLLAANYVQTSTKGAGTGFAQRLLTEPDGDIVEDNVVSTTGSYNASASLANPGWWVMQIVAFRAAGSPEPMPTPSPSPTLETPAYVQGNYAVPQTGQTVTLPYAAVQTAGDLNVVIVGWSDATNVVSSVTDARGNTYQLAVGPTRNPVVGGGYYANQSIYYAKNIAGGSNSVTVTFSGAAAYPDIRILEYSGLDPTNPLDVVNAASGSGTTNSSGPITTTSASELLVAANTVTSSTTGPGSGFTERILTSPDGDIAEDRIVSSTGSYTATTPLVSGSWVMQIVAFRAAGSPNPTPSPSPTPETPAYVQGAYAAPQTGQTVTVPYTSAQTAGDLNVVIVGWSDGTNVVSSVTDAQGNTYQLAVGPTRNPVIGGGYYANQSIYYAKNIASGTNSVTVTFSAMATYPDIRILEYSGLDATNPLDVVNAASGSGTTNSSGPITTTSASELLVAANTVTSTTTGPGSGFTKRILTSPDGDIAEDRIVSSTGSYSATVSLTPGSWVMQIVAFRAAGSPPPTSGPTPTPAPTPTPTPTPGPTPSPTPTPGQVSLGWDQDPDSSTIGYILYCTTDSGLLTSGGNVPPSGTVLQSNYPGIGTTTATVTHLNSGQTYYFGVAAYNATNQMSLLSNVVSAVAP
jgi:hypothetical protein